LKRWNTISIRSGVVITKIKGLYHVESDGEIFECKLRGILKKKNDKLNCIVGDYVEFGENGFITKVKTRKNMITRPLVANIDYLVIQFAAVDPKMDYERFNMLLLNAYYYNIKPIAVINKIDLINEEEKEEILTNLAFLKDLDIPLFLVSTYNKTESIKDLKEHLAGTITAFGGPSGVGKSSILNELQDKMVLEVGETSKKLSRGKHTTKGTTLLKMEEGGYLIDTPGFSSLELPPVEDSRSLTELFPEFRGIPCKFNNCVHINEPKCGIKEFVEKGKIYKSRYEFYKKCYEIYTNERWNKYD